MDHSRGLHPATFNSDVFFELPPCRGSTSPAKGMEGLDKQYDSLTWSHIITSNIHNDVSLKLRKSYCVGYLIYLNITFICSKCLCMNLGMVLILYGKWNQGATFKIVLSCFIMLNGRIMNNCHMSCPWLRILQSHDQCHLQYANCGH